MSELFFDRVQVVGVLLSDGWHEVADGSLEVGEFTLPREPNAGYIEYPSAVAWREPTGEYVYCPLVEVKAYKLAL